MGKGSNVQKAQQARERNQKKLGKSDEERKSALAKAKKDASAFVCEICKQSFMVNARPPVLHLHVTSRHGDGFDYKQCFPTALADFDPTDPNGDKKAAQERAASEAAAKRKSKRASVTGGGLDLLDAGLGSIKKSGKAKRPSARASSTTAARASTTSTVRDSITSSNAESIEGPARDSIAPAISGEVPSEVTDSMISGITSISLRDSVTSVSSAADEES